MKVKGRKSHAEIDVAEHGGRMIALVRKTIAQAPLGIPQFHFGRRGRAGAKAS